MAKNSVDNKTSIQGKQSAIAVALILILAASAIMTSIPNVAAKTSFSMDLGLYPLIGVNSPTELSWVPTPPESSPLLQSPAYEGKTSVWPDAVVTLTRPDETKDVVRGPFKARPSLVQGRATRVDIVLIYTPNVMGKWNVNFYWPGDSTYEAVNQTETFTVGAHFEKRSTWAYVSLRPYPNVGVNQPLLVNAWVTPAPLHQRDYYENFMFTFTSPSGTSTKIGPMDSELSGTVWFDLPLTEIGAWTIKLDFPGDHANLPSTVTRTINVQKDPVNVGYPDTPLPTAQWTFPINVQNREWRNIAGPWYQSNYNASVGAYNPYTEAPTTPHILWKLPAVSSMGGFIGSPHSTETGGGEAAYNAGDAGIYSATVPTIRTVMNGMGYYTTGGMIYCVDMQTGNQVWSVPGSFNTGAERSRVPVLYQFGSRFIAYNALTGAVTLNLTGQPMTFFDNPYVYTSSGGRLLKWDTTGTSTNFTSRILWNITDPAAIGGGFARYSFSAIQSGIWVVLDTAGPDSDDPANPDKVPTNNQDKALIGINCTTGEFVYNKKVSNPADPNSWIYRQGPMGGSGYGLYYTAVVPSSNEGRGWIAFDVATGTIKWTSEKADAPWGNFWSYMPEASGEGYIIATGYSGVYAFNPANGKIAWHYIDYDTYNEEPYQSNIAPNGSSYGSYSFGSTGPIIGGGVVFAPNTEHSPTFIYRGQGLNAINASTGEKLWKIMGVYTPTAIAYGVLLASDSWNGYTYAFGKGTTETTVSTQNDVIAKGSSIVLKGTVIDTSSAQKGTAAISDASMTDWMQYLHMQQPKPTNAKGVPVHLTAIDPNGNFQNIGTATSDVFGNYAIMWTPPVPGLYTVTATFEGSGSYYGSEAGIAFGVSESASAAPVVTPTPTATQPSVTPVSPTPVSPTPVSPSPTQAVNPPTSAEPTTTYIAIGIAVVVIVAVAAALVLKRRK